MVTFENQNIEFKQEYVPDIRKEVMGFANADERKRFFEQMQRENMTNGQKG